MNNLGKFIRSAIKPLARFAIRHGVKFQEFSEFTKQAFVDASRTELAKNQDQSNVSKMAVMTGLQRRDVTRLINNQAPSTESLNLLTKIIGQWASDKRFSKKGKALDLTFEGVGSDFFNLVQSVSKDMNPYTVLFELERINAVEKKNDLLVLKGAALDISRDKDKSLALLSNDIEDLFTGVEENIFMPGPVPNLHITTRYDNILPEAIPEIKLWLLEKGAAFHQSARAFISRFDRDINAKLKSDGDKASISIGSFSSFNTEEKLPKKKSANL